MRCNERSGRLVPDVSVLLFKIVQMSQKEILRDIS